MLKNKKKKIFMIPSIIVLLIVLFLVIRVIIYPNWLTQSSEEIAEVHVSSELLDLKITDQKTVMKLYKLCKNTRIKNLEFDTSEGNRDTSDGFSIVFTYKNNSSDIIKCRKDAIVLKQPTNVLFWTRGEENEELLSLLLEIESSENSHIKTDQEQIFTEVEGYLKEYEQDFNKIISLAKANKSGRGSISLTRNYLKFNNPEVEEQCLSLMKKTKVSGVSFGKNYVSFIYESQPEYLTSIIYNYNDDKKEKESLWKIIKKIKPFYYMECITLLNK